MKNHLILIFATFLALAQPPLAFSQGIQQKTVIAKGEGKTEKDAIKDALVAAVSQVRGLAISSKETVALRDQIHNESSTSSSDYQSNIQTFTNGIVSQYEILETGHSKLTGNTSVQIKATIPVYSAGPQINRLRLAVVPLKLSSTINDKTSAGQFAKNWMSV
jgi:hypothetical protein